MYLTCFRHILWRLFFASTFSSRGYVYIDIRVYIDIVQQSLSCLCGHVWLYVLTMRKMHWYTFKMPSNKVPLSLSLVRQLLDRRKGRKTSNRLMHKTPNNQQKKNLTRQLRNGTRIDRLWKCTHTKHFIYRFAGSVRCVCFFWLSFEMRQQKESPFHFDCIRIQWKWKCRRFQSIVT